MKKLLLMVSLMACVTLAQAQAQTTNVTTVAPTTGITIPGISIGTTGVSTNAIKAANDLIPMVEQLVPYLTNIVGLSLDADAIYSSGNKWGGIGSLNFAIPQLSNSVSTVSMGLAAEDLADQWYLAPITVTLGKSINIPVINYPLYMFAGSGLSERISDSALGMQTLTGGSVILNLGKGWYIIGDGGRLFMTQTHTPASSWFGGLRVGKSF